MKRQTTNNPTRDELNIDAEVAAMNRQTVGELRQRYLDVFGETSRSGNRTHLIRRIAWRLQAQREGGLSQRARERAAELACEADLRVSAPRRVAVVDDIQADPRQTIEVRLGRTSTPTGKGLPMAGAMLRREYKGRMIVVRVLPQGFEYEGEMYRSLSAVAKKVTGSHWNGRLFFGLTDGDRKEKTA